MDREKMLARVRAFIDHLKKGIAQMEDEGHCDKGEWTWQDTICEDTGIDIKGESIDHLSDADLTKIIQTFIYFESDTKA